ncbi:MAG: hypothetical protein WC516_06515 [Patescibacteria group bacterium]
MARTIMQMRDSDPKLWHESITRRGQHIYWYSASPCFCSSDNGRIDANCHFCYGKGFVYNTVTSSRRIIVCVTDRANIIYNDKVKIKSINRLVVGRDTELTVQSFTANTIIPQNGIGKGVRYLLDYEEDFEDSYLGVCSYIGKGIIIVPVISKSNQGVYSNTVTKINNVRNTTKNTNINVISFWSNRILTDSVIDSDDVLEIDCVYVLSVVFLISGINPKTKMDNLAAQQADCQMSFPGTYQIGRGDLIVLQTAEIKSSFIGINDGAFYKFPFFRVAQILELKDQYGDITDYTLVRDNEIVWGSKRPNRFSCTFTYNPAFAVLDDVPSVRYAEDKIWPKKVYLKKFTMFTYPETKLKFMDPNLSEIGIIDDPRKTMEYEGIL